MTVFSALIMLALFAIVVSMLILFEFVNALLLVSTILWFVSVIVTILFIRYLYPAYHEYEIFSDALKHCLSFLISSVWQNKRRRYISSSSETVVNTHHAHLSSLWSVLFHPVHCDWDANIGR